MNLFPSEAQCGFRAGRGTRKIAFILKQFRRNALSKTCNYTWFSLTLLKLLQRYGCPVKFTNFIEAMHKNMQAKVSLNGKLSDLFPVLNRVKQVCVLAPTLFYLFLTATLMHAFHDCKKGVLIQSRPNSNIFNVNQFKPTRKTKGLLVKELVFADYTAFISHNFDDA